MLISLLKTLTLLLIIVSISMACRHSCKYCAEDGETCEGCYAGYVFSSDRSGNCEPCPGGYISEDSSYICTACPAGTYSADDGSYCAYCPEGYISTEGSNYCSRCPEGSVPDEGQGACVACGAGLWADHGDSECSSCGQYCEVCGSSTKCRECEYFAENVHGRCLFSCSQAEGMNVTFGDCVDGVCGVGCQECGYGGFDCFACYPDDLPDSAPYLVCSLPESPTGGGEESSGISLKSVTKSSTSGLDATSVIAKSLAAGSSIAFRFGVVAEVIRNARYFSVAYSEKTVNIFAEEDSDPFDVNAPGSFDNQKGGSKPLHRNFVKYDVEPNFLINYWSNLVSILILSACLGMFKLSEIYLKKNELKKKVWARRMLRMLKISAANYLINNLYGSFDQILLFFIFEIQTCSFVSAFSLSSFICAVLFLIIGLGFFGFHFYILRKYQAAKSNGGTQDQEKNDEKKLQAFKSKHAHVKVFYEDFKDDSFSRQSFLAPLMIRSCTLNAFLCLLVDYPLVEASLYLAVNLAFAIFLVVKRPFEEFKNAAAQYFCEIIILITYSGVLALTIMDSNGTAAASSRENLEKAIVILGIILNIGGLIFQCIEIFGTIYEVYRSFKAWRSKSKVAASAPVKARAKNAAKDLTSQKESARPLSLYESSSTSSNQNLISLSSSPTRTRDKTQRFAFPSTIQSLTNLSPGSQSDLDKENKTMIAQSEPRSETIIGEKENVGSNSSRKIEAGGVSLVMSPEKNRVFERVIRRKGPLC